MVLAHLSSWSAIGGLPSIMNSYSFGSYKQGDICRINQQCHTYPQAFQIVSGYPQTIVSAIGGPYCIFPNLGYQVCQIILVWLRGAIQLCTFHPKSRCHRPKKTPPNFVHVFQQLLWSLEGCQHTHRITLRTERTTSLLGGFKKMALPSSQPCFCLVQDTLSSKSEWQP